MNYVGVPSTDVTIKKDKDQFNGQIYVFRILP
jgi:hypothetical protein